MPLPPTPLQPSLGSTIAGPQGPPGPPGPATGITDIGSAISQTRVQYWSGNVFPAGGVTVGINCVLGIGHANLGVYQSGTNLLQSCARGTAFTSSTGPDFLGSYDAAAQSGSYKLSYVLRGAATGIGGFTLTTRFGIELVTTSSLLYCFVGLIDSTGGGGGLPQYNGIDFTTQTTFQVVGCGFTQTVAGGALTGNWKIISCNGATTTVTDSGIPLVVGNLVELQLVAAPDASSITWTLNDLSAVTSGTGSITSDLPSNTLALAWQAGMTVQSGGAPPGNQFDTVRYTMESNN